MTRMPSLKNRGYKLGAWIRQFRHIHGMTQIKFAEYSGVSQSKIRGYENGCLPSGFIITKKLADAMRISTDTLYGSLDSDTVEHANSDSLRALSKRAHSIAKSKDWWVDYDQAPQKYKPYIIATKIALIGSEVSEMLEAARRNMFGEETVNGKPEGVPPEGADVLIRLLDLFEKLGIDISGATLRKIKYNETRPIKHGNKVF